MTIEKELRDAAIKTAEDVYPTGWAGAAAMRTESGKILTSVAPEILQDGLALCMEVGSICEAHKLKEKVTHSICVSRSEDESEFKILSPCGICQERLYYWGYDVKVGVTTPTNRLEFKTLKQLMPYHWQSAFRD